MRRKQFQDLSLPLLGMGNMRLPTTGPNGPIDREKAREIIDYVYGSGVNYFDTAYMYHDGQSELFLGEELKRFPRDSFFLADKMPDYPLREGKTPQEVFEEQLRKCQTDYFDFYLLHNVSENTFDTFMDEKLSIVPYLLEQKKAGRIRHLGFSSHSRPETLKRFLDNWDCFEFVQIQLNYIDWTLQNAQAQYEIITQYGAPVWVMEPCRGGRLASLSPESDSILKKARPDLSIASWAFRWLLNLPNVQLALSGMTQMDQAVDNVRTFSQEPPLSEAERAALDQAVELFRSQINIPCTQCHYCDGCPQGLDIPRLLHMYNGYRLDPGPGAQWAYNALPEEQRADQCVTCGQCARKCPQHIDIPAELKNYAQAMTKPGLQT